MCLRNYLPPVAPRIFFVLFPDRTQRSISSTIAQKIGPKNSRIMTANHQRNRRVQFFQNKISTIGASDQLWGLLWPSSKLWIWRYVVQASPVALFSETKNFPPLCLFIQVYKWVPATCCCGVLPCDGLSIPSRGE